MEKNLSTMKNFFKGKKANFWAHTKVHKSSVLARRELEMGAKGVCCQKVSEAQVMAEDGINCITVTNPIVTTQKIDRLVALSRLVDIRAIVDFASNAESISNAAVAHGTKLKVLVEAQLGANRCGVEPGDPALSLARIVGSLWCFGLMGRGSRGIRLADAHSSKFAGRRLKYKVPRTRLAGYIQNSGAF